MISVSCVLLSPYEYLKCDIEIYYAPLWYIYIKRTDNHHKNTITYKHTFIYGKNHTYIHTHKRTLVY